MRQNHCYQGYMRLQSQIALLADEDRLQPGGPWPAAARLCCAQAKGFGRVSRKREASGRQPEMRLGSSPVWEACCPMTHFAIPQIWQNMSLPSHAELLPGPQIKSKQHFLIFLWFFIFYILYHCSPVFCHLGAGHLWGMMPGIGSNYHKTGTTHWQLSPVKRSSHISL